MKRVIHILRFGSVLMILGIGVLLYNCAPKKNLAPDHNFYFEITTNSDDQFSKKLAEYLKEQIPKKKYTITNHSGLTWPFYKEINLEESIPKDSLMSPHWYLHKMIPFESIEKIERDEFLVRIDLLPQLDAPPNYSVKIFRMEPSGLVLSAESGIHSVDVTEFPSGISLSDLYLRSIIRYSFK